MRDDALPVALHVAQPERQGRLVDLGQHLAEELLVLRLAHAQARLRHVIAKRYRLGQQVRPPGEDRPHLALDAGQRGVVHHQMVEQHVHQPALMSRVVRHDGAQQRRAAQVEPHLARIEARLQLPVQLALACVEHHLLDLQRRLAPDDLHRLADPLPMHRGAQDVVARDHALHRVEEAIEPRAAVEREHRVEQVGVALAGHQVMEQHALLQRRERIDVLHVGRPARHAGHQARDLVLAERHQAQHVGRDDGFGLPPVAVVHQLEQRGLVFAQAGQQLAVVQLAVAMDHQRIPVAAQPDSLFE
nr:hypothetical protein [Burkholderia gladioli]